LSDFELGSILERQVISYSALERMKDDFDNDYDNLRDTLGVPTIYDFAITFENEAMSDLNMEFSSGIPDGVEVMAKDYVFEVLQSDGTFGNERINFRIW